MLKFSLLISLLLGGILSSQAQLNLTGLFYHESFDNLNQGLPQGWEIVANAGPSFKGNPLAFDTTRKAWGNTSGAFKNFASNTNIAFEYLLPAAQQSLFADRSLGLRPNSVFADSGGAFVLQIAHTINLSNFNLTFSLQSLDSGSNRLSIWKLQYAIGANPTIWTNVATSGVMTTGGNTFSNNVNSATFGSALNNQNGPVWIRIVNLTKSTGSGSRASTGIDNFKLNWSNNSPSSYRPNITALTPFNHAQGVLPSANLMLTFDRNVSAGIGNFYITNENLNSTQTIAATSSSVTINGKNVTLSAVSQNYGATYHVTFDSTAIDTAGYFSYGLYDTTNWQFSTASPIITVQALHEYFDSCVTNRLPLDWNERSVLGDGQHWQCGGNFYATMSAGPAAITNEDWLVTPQLNLSQLNNPHLTWKMRWHFTGPSLELFASSDYIGYGDPNLANWANIPINYQAVDSGKWRSHSTDLSAFISSPFFLAFKYTSNPNDGGSQWDVDSVTIESLSGIYASQLPHSPLVVVGMPAANVIRIQLQANREGLGTFSLIDAAGRLIKTYEVQTRIGLQEVQLSTPHLPAGIYTIRVVQGDQCAVTRTYISQ